ncbi:MAG TPA: glucose-1-phosphate adenylyltransferase [Planctomycetota bacterium]|nr:glucose-1-phosphate adenylyltransferase [Planctomycetota bacterium]
MGRTTHNMLKETLAVVLAGGQGERLYPLTKDRAKPAVPFGGVYRIIDFTLSNAVNSGLRRIDVLTQYKSYSLQRHLQLGWDIFNFELGEYLQVIPPQQRMASVWYRGTADALYQNIYILEKERPQWVLILSGDHIYKMDYARMLQYHVDRGADLTVACIEVNREEASRFGIVRVDEDSRIIDFEEKPADPKPIPGRPDAFLGSMGVYVFNTEELVRQVIVDSKRSTDHDFGRNILPQMIHNRDVFAYNFAQGSVGNPYWRDIGTIDAYWSASQDLLESDPPFVIDDPAWPIRTYQGQYPPARIVSTERDPHNCGAAINSLICAGSVIHNARVSDSILSPGVVVEEGAEVEGCMLMQGTVVAKGCKIHNTIIDKYVHIPPGTQIGINHEEDSHRFTVTKSGVVVIPKELPFEQGFEVPIST